MPIFTSIGLALGATSAAAFSTGAVVAGLGATMLGGTLGSAAYSASAAKTDQKKAQSAADEAKKIAEQKSLMESQTEGSNAAARKSLLAQPTSGFGPNKNLARSFLTTL